MDEIIISEDLVLVNETVQNSEEIIRKLGKLLLEEKYVKDSFVEAVLDREKIFPTGLQLGSTNHSIPGRRTCIKINCGDSNSEISGDIHGDGQPRG